MSGEVKVFPCDEHGGIMRLEFHRALDVAEGCTDCEVEA